MRIFCTIVFLSLFALNVQAQKDSNKSKEVITGLKISKKYAYIFQKNKSKSFKFLNNTIKVNSGYKITRSPENRFYIHSENFKLPTNPKVAHDSETVEETDELLVVFHCAGCIDDSGCLVGYVDDYPNCTSCTSGCDSFFELIPLDMNQIQVETSTGF